MAKNPNGVRGFVWIHQSRNHPLDANRRVRLTLLRMQKNVTNSTATHDRVPNDWTRLSRRIAEGDTTAFEIYFEEFFQLMLDEAQRLTNRDEATCLDIVQNSMLKVIKSMKPMNGKQHVIAWTRILVRCTALDWLRERSNQLPRSLDENCPLTSEQEESLDVSARLIWIEGQLQLCEPSTKKMISLRYRMGWSLKRIAAQFGLRTGAVDGRIRRAVDKIRKNAMKEELE